MFPFVPGDATHVIDRFQSAAAALFAAKKPEPSYPRLPRVRENGESSVRGVYLIGEVGGTPLIKLGLNQGVEVIERINQELGGPQEGSGEELYDVVIIGAGSSGLGAAMRAHELGLRYVVLESERVAMTVVNMYKGKLLFADSLPATEEQLRLFEERKRRDPAAADRALARLRAELGDAAVVRARLRDAHLPEARFIWEQITHVQAAQPGEAGGNVLVRRLFDKPVPLPSRSRNEPDGWMLRGLQHGPVVRTQGPHIVSGGWWRRSVHREYHFAETQQGELLWIFYDRYRRKWFMHGRVE